MSLLRRYACAWVPRFAAAALVRRDPDLRGRPVAVLRGTAATRRVGEVSAEAGGRGVRPGMSATEARTWVPDLVTRDQDPDAERAATAALLDAAWALSPRVEATGPDRVCLDLAGLPALRHSAGARAAETRLAECGMAMLAALGLPARVAIAGTRTAARLLAQALVDIPADVTVVPPGTESHHLAGLPIALLTPIPEVALTLERWGIVRLGELAALPRAALLARLGVSGLRLQAEARGIDVHPFVAAVPPEIWVEALALDWEVTSVEGLAFVLHRLCERLAARLEVRGRGATALTLTCRLAGGGAHVHRRGGLAPLAEPRTLGRLLLGGLEGLTLPAPVVGLALEAETAALAALQADLFAPPRPSPRQLGEILGRLAALVGPEQVGAPTLEDTHRPDAIGTAPFEAAVAGSRGSGRAGMPLPPEPCGSSRTSAIPPPGHVTGATLVRRRLVPPLAAEVEIQAGRPVTVTASGVRGRVLAAAGPWRTAGEWWADTGWAREEWDVALPDGAVYRLAQDLTTRRWTLDAVYD
jgi:protein ImuB